MGVFTLVFGVQRGGELIKEVLSKSKVIFCLEHGIIVNLHRGGQVEVPTIVAIVKLLAHHRRAVRLHLDDTGPRIHANGRPLLRRVAGPRTGVHHVVRTDVQAVDVVADAAVAEAVLRLAEATNLFRTRTNFRSGGDGGEAAELADDALQAVRGDQITWGHYLENEELRKSIADAGAVEGEEAATLGALVQLRPLQLAVEEGDVALLISRKIGRNLRLAVHAVAVGGAEGLGTEVIFNGASVVHVHDGEGGEEGEE